MPHPTRTAVLLWAVLLAAAPRAATQEPSRITLDEALQLFARNNLELRVAQAEAA